MVGAFELADRDLKWRLSHQVRLWQENALHSLGEIPQWNEWLDYHSRQSTFTSRDIRTQIDEYPRTFNGVAWNLYWWIPEATRLFKSKKYPPPCGCPEWKNWGTQKLNLQNRAHLFTFRCGQAQRKNLLQDFRLRKLHCFLLVGLPGAQCKVIYQNTVTGHQ